MLVYHFVDLELRAEIFFQKRGAVEKGSIDFEIGDIETSVYLYWKLKKKIKKMLDAFIFFGDKKRKNLTF